jgi:hypothetical protein
MKQNSQSTINESERSRTKHGSDEAPSGTGELRAVTDRILETGVRYLARGRELFRREIMRSDRDWNEDRQPRGSNDFSRHDRDESRYEDRFLGRRYDQEKEPGRTSGQSRLVRCSSWL